MPAGRCTLRLTHAAAQVEVSQQAHADVVTTDCGTMTVPGSRLATATWTGTVSYDVGAQHGTSTQFSVQVSR